MAQENEIKIMLKKISLDQFIKRIKSKKFKLQKTVSQIDIYFDTKNWFLYKNIAALRLRLIDGKDNSFSFKKVFYTPKRNNKYYVEEIEIKFPLHDLDLLSKIFKKLKIKYANEIFNTGQDLTNFLKIHSFFDEQVMPKTRQIFIKGSDEIVLDDVENVGQIIELECQENDPLTVVKSILNDNEWERSIEGTSYIWLKNVKGLNSHIENVKRFETDPTWNVWSNEREFYKKIITK